MHWIASDIAARAEKGFNAAWVQLVDMAPEGGYKPLKEGKPHAGSELVQRLRRVLLAAGYSEVALPEIMSYSEMGDAAGPAKALAIADTFSLAASVRPKPAISKAQLDAIKGIAPTFNEERRAALENAFRGYSEGQLNSQQLLSEMVGKAGLRMEQALEVANLLVGIPHQQQQQALLRRGLVYSWFPTLAALSKKQPLPLQLFSIGTGFRQGRMREGTFVSGAIMAENVSHKDLKGLLPAVLGPLSAKVGFEKAVATSTVFVPGTEEAIFAEGLHLGRLGLASPIALSAYGLEAPVAIFELSVERLAIALGLGHDEKEIKYPQFFGKWKMEDKEIARLVHIGQKPPGWGREIKNRIIKTCSLYYGQPAPCEFRIFEKEVGDSKLEVWLSSDKGTLCGKDFSNEVVVYDGNVVSTPQIAATPVAKEALAKGTKTGITLIGAFASYAAAAIEANPTKAQEIAVGNITSPSEANIVVPQLVMDYIKQNGKELGIAGSLGLRVVARVKRLWQHEQPR